MATRTAAPLDDYMETVATAHELDVTTVTLWRWHKDGIGPQRHYIGRKPLYLRSEVERFRDEQRHGRA